MYQFSKYYALCVHTYISLSVSNDPTPSRIFMVTTGTPPEQEIQNTSLLFYLVRYCSFPLFQFSPPQCGLCLHEQSL